MIKSAELFAKLASEMEDLHAIAIEGQDPDHPRELLVVLANQSCNGLQRCSQIVAELSRSVAAT